MQVHVYGGSEPEYTNGRKDFILGPRLEEGTSFRGEGAVNFESSLGGNRCFFNIRFQFKEPLPLVVINDASLKLINFAKF